MAYIYQIRIEHWHATEWATERPCIVLLPPGGNLIAIKYIL